MVSLVPGKSSSSPSVRIQSITEEGSSGEVLRVLLDDGSLFLLDNDLAKDFFPGQLVGEEQAAALSQGAERRDCLSKGLKLLAQREHSCRALERKLLKRGFSPVVVDHVLDTLRTKNWLDDGRFARIWLESRLRKHPEGPSRLLSALINSWGVGRDTAAAAVEEVLKEGSAGVLARAGEKLKGRSGMSSLKLYRGLLSRGFASREILSWMEQQGLPFPEKPRLSQDNSEFF